MKRGGAIFVAGLFVLLLLAAVFIQACGTAPRSAQFCSKNGEWVKCPAGIEAGTDLGVKR